MSWIRSLGLVAACIAPAFAQISSGCNPLNTTVSCPPDVALGIEHTWNFANDTLDDNMVWNITNGAVSYGQGNAQFIIAKRGDAPTVQSTFRFFWGQASVVMKAAKGQGIVSSLTYLSDDLDEVDWEWIGGNNTHVQTNYFGKGNTTVYDRAVWVPVNDPIGTYHNYSINWNKNVLQWIIDGNVARSLPVAQADDGGKQFPQTPLDVRMGIWAGGDDTLAGVSNWTAQWAGGAPDYSQTPFTMSVQSVTVNDGTQGASTYTYGDKTGNWNSIKVAMGNSTAAQAINTPPAESITQKFNGLSTGAKIGIACAIGGVVLALAVCCTFCCVRKRKEGRREREAADADWDRANSEMLAYRQAMATPRGDTFSNNGYAANPNPFSDSKTDLMRDKEFGGHGMGQGYPLSPMSPATPGSQVHLPLNGGGAPQQHGYFPQQSPNPQYAPVQHRF